MIRTLITGASGFVGANLTRKLISNGYEVHALLRPEHALWRLPEVRDAIRICNVDLEDGEAVARTVASVRPQWVFHLAAFGAYSHQIGLRRMVETNLLGTANLVDASVNFGVETFIQTGSSSEYGYHDRPTTEDTCLHPNSNYALTKAAATHYCSLIAEQRNWNAITVRLYSIYGPYEDPNRLVPTLILHGLRGKFPPLVSPQTARDFVYVEDAVDAMLRIAQLPGVDRGSVFNICSGVQHSLAEIVETAAGIMNIPGAPVWSSMQARRWDTDRWVGSPELTARKTGWRATTSLELGLRKTVAWLETHPEMAALYSTHIFPKDA